MSDPVIIQLLPNDLHHEIKGLTPGTRYVVHVKPRYGSVFGKNETAREITGNRSLAQYGFMIQH